MTANKFLVTGAFGCIGSWILRNLVLEQTEVIAADLSSDPVRPRLLLNEDQLSQVTFAQTDITDFDSLKELLERHQVSHIIHLAGLQVPFCRANPPLGASVNVVGTVNVFECTRQLQDQIKGLVYASSIAVMGPPSRYTSRPIGSSALRYPETLYGVYKQANEDTARVYWQDWKIPSVGLRPYIVYGVGRDQGLTSDLAKAILAAAADVPYHIQFGGSVALQYAEDVARMFIESSRSGHQGATVCNLRNDIISVERFVEILKQALPNAEITYEQGNELPFPADMDDSSLGKIIGDIPHTPLVEAIQTSADFYRDLLQKGQLDLGQLQTMARSS